MECLVRANALDRDNLRVVRLSGKEQTGAHRPAVEHNRASPAYTMLAADMGSHQTKIVAQKIHQGAARLNDRRSFDSVYFECNRDFFWHYALPLTRLAATAKARRAKTPARWRR